jgi:hypothetical protein
VVFLGDISNFDIEGAIDVRCDNCGKTNTFKDITRNDSTYPASAEITVLSDLKKREAIDATYERLSPFIKRRGNGSQ